jgi:hypothetical protein
MINVYVNSLDDNSGKDWLWVAPKKSNIVNGCEFFFDDDYILKNKIHIDFFIIYNRAKPSKLLNNINIKNSLILAIEPPSVHNYKFEYLQQFGYVFCSDPNYNYPNKQKNVAITPWSVGHNKTWMGTNDYNLEYKNLDYDQLRDFKFKKKKLISVIQTGKRYCKEHYIRDEIIRILIEKFPDHIDSFGRDTNFVSNKFDALKDYYYHICIGNYWGSDHWDEKIMDPLIAKCNPIYLGCKNIKDYFDTEFYKLDKESVKKNIELIKKIISKSDHQFEYEKQRNMVFDKYNFFIFLSKFIKKNITTLFCNGSIKSESNLFILKLKTKRFISRYLK